MRALVPGPTTVHRPWPFFTCPDCGHDEFEVTSNDEPNVVFRCSGCLSSWRYVMGYLQQVAAPPLPAIRSAPTPSIGFGG